jgi:hypothetical protein
MTRAVNAVPAWPTPAQQLLAVAGAAAGHGAVVLVLRTVEHAAAAQHEGLPEDAV